MESSDSVQSQVGGVQADESVWPPTLSSSIFNLVKTAIVLKISPFQFAVSCIIISRRCFRFECLQSQKQAYAF
jgi:hypothetical protein